MDRTVGIDALDVYTPGYALSLDDLAAARGVPPEKISIGLGAQEMAVAPPWEDTVTLGANAAARLVARGLLQPEEVGLLLVATETAVDHAKPVGIFLHELLGLPASCRVVELKHACYSGTAGVMLAAGWVRAGAARGKKALVVAADIARYDLGSSAEFTQGAGAAALVVSAAPRLLALDAASGVYARNVYDFWRPLDRREALVDGKFSVDCYLDALDSALRDWRLNGGAEDDLTARMAALCYHTPFPKMAFKAHGRLVGHERQRLGRPDDGLDDDVAHSFARLVDSSLGATRRIGNTYTASLYIGLAWLAEREAARVAGREIGLFSYGSGCCAEFFTGRFAPDLAPVTGRLGLAAQLAGRRRLTVSEYEAFARGGAPAYDAIPSDEVPAVRFVGVRDEKRYYARSGPAL